jgi:Tfp pilus assembly protein PilE
VRALSLLSLVVSLAIVGVLVNAQVQRSGTTSKDQAIAAAKDAAQAGAALSFQQAATALEQFHAANGTYAGADLGGYGVALMRADASSYCVQVDAGDRVYHEAGPHGSPAAGTC